MIYNIPTAYLGIDLASRYSGFAILDDETKLQWYSTLDVGPESDGFKSNVTKLCDFIEKTIVEQYLDLGPVVVYIEDCPVQLVKPALVLRLQGALRQRIYTMMPEAEVHMVMPSQWQRWAGWSKTPGITSKGFSKFACTVLGYEFTTDKTITAKQKTDLYDAVLIARYGWEQVKVMK